jgi:hypothetical protein
LIASTRTAHIAKRAADFDIVIKADVHIDFKKVIARKDHMNKKPRDRVMNWLSNTDILAVNLKTLSNYTNSYGAYAH